MLSLLVLFLTIQLVSCANIVVYGNDIPFNDSLTVPCTATNLTSVKYVFYEPYTATYTIHFQGASYDNQIINKIDYCNGSSCSYYYNETDIKFCFILIMKYGNNKISYILDQTPIQISAPQSVDNNLGGKIGFGVVGGLLLAGGFGSLIYITFKRNKQGRQITNKPATHAVA